MDNKQISSDTLAELAELVLNDNIFEFDGSTFKQKRGTALETKFAPPYANFYGRFWGKNVRKLWKKNQWFGGGI